MNQVEIWFSILVRKVLKAAHFHFCEDLKCKVLAFIDTSISRWRSLSSGLIKAALSLHNYLRPSVLVWRSYYGLFFYSGNSFPFHGFNHFFHSSATLDAVVFYCSSPIRPINARPHRWYECQTIAR